MVKVRAFGLLAAAMAACLAWPAAAIGQQSAREPAPAPPVQPLVSGSPRLAASLERIARGSSLWRSEVESLRQSGRYALVIASDQVVVADPEQGTRPAIDAGVLAEVAVVPEGPSAVSAVLVVVNLELLDDVHARRGSLPAERDRDLDRILVHEVYGHALPYLLAGDMSGRCADPAAGERPSDACSIRRENAVRAQLGLGRRTDYGFGALALGHPAPAGPRGLVLAVAPR